MFAKSCNNNCIMLNYHKCKKIKQLPRKTLIIPLFSWGDSIFPRAIAPFSCLICLSSLLICCISNYYPFNFFNVHINKYWPLFTHVYHFNLLVSLEFILNILFTCSTFSQLKMRLTEVSHISKRTYDTKYYFKFVVQKWQ